MSILITINTIIFLLIAAIHIYWAFGGKWGANAVIPTQNDGQLSFKPDMIATLVVATGLLLMALVTVSNSIYFNFNHWIDKKYIFYGNWAVTAIFFLRAIGDFRYIGFTKRIKDSAFAINDTKFYSPLCLVIACISFAIVIFTH
jgi:hypothetical protein